jgi:hypothetical protein
MASTVTICPMVFLGCNWQGTFGSPAEAKAAELEHWDKKHADPEGSDDENRPSTPM